MARHPYRSDGVDISKGDTKEPNYRSRLVAKEMNTYKKDDLFAVAPPLGAMKTVLFMVAINNKGETIMINDASRAFFHAKAKRDVYVALPEEDRLPGEEGMCAKLNFSLHGTMDAAINWHDEYSQQLVSNGFSQGIAPPCVFYRTERKIAISGYGERFCMVRRVLGD